MIIENKTLAAKGTSTAANIIVVIVVVVTTFICVNKTIQININNNQAKACVHWFWLKQYTHTYIQRVHNVNGDFYKIYFSRAVNSSGVF